jgi:hypothetical protein
VLIIIYDYYTSVYVYTDGPAGVIVRGETSCPCLGVRRGGSGEHGIKNREKKTRNINKQEGNNKQETTNNKKEIGTRKQEPGNIGSVYRVNGGEKGNI